MDDEAVAGNKKNARRRKAWILFQDESGVSERPPVRRTWAPKGETPVLVYAFNWKKLSISAALGYRWDGKRCRLWFQTQPGSYNDERLIAFVRDLKKHLRGQKAILIWDGLPAHKSRKMKQYLESQRGWLEVETLPGYSPDLNPVEDLWSNIKGQELANRCVAGLGEAEDGVSSGMDRVRQSMLPFSFLHHAGLFFDPSCHPITRGSLRELPNLPTNCPGQGKLWSAGANPETCRGRNSTQRCKVAASVSCFSRPR